MKINKRDQRLTKNEYAKIIDKMNTDTFLTFDKEHYQCADCHHIFPRSNSKCPVCNNKGGERITRGKTRYDLRTAVQTFRKVGNHVVELVFLFTDYMNKQERKLERDIKLIRKSEYRDKVTVYLNNKVSYNSGLRLFALWDYWGNYISGYSKQDGWSEDKPSNVRASTLGAQYESINKHILLEHKILNRIYAEVPWDEFQWIDNKHLEQALKYPYIVEMLNKRSKRDNKYYALASINRYQDAYKKYHKYFERYGNFNPKLLAKLNRVEGMLKYNIFERLMGFYEIPKNIKTKRDLELYAGLATKEYGSYRFDESSYKDYLRMAAERGLNIQEEKVKFNSKWSVVHDTWMNEAKLEEEMIKESKFVEIYTNYPDEQIKGVVIEAPHSIKDLFNESEHLKHCVKTYTDRIVKGESLILFVRKQPGEPFITAEIRNGKIEQIRGFKNKTDMIRPEHKKALQTYVKRHLATA